MDTNRNERALDGPGNIATQVYTHNSHISTTDGSLVHANHSMT